MVRADSLLASLVSISVSVLSSVLLSSTCQQIIALNGAIGGGGERGFVPLLSLSRGEIS